ncbi:MAG: alpha-amylase family glycosyl hydrolase, partial [Planctomycetota bacterium]
MSSRPAFVESDPGLVPHLPVIEHRLDHVRTVAERLTDGDGSARALWDFAQAHRHFGLHRSDTPGDPRERGWVFREWAPAADRIFLCGEFSGWECDPRFELHRTDQPGQWEVELPAAALAHGDRYHLRLQRGPHLMKRLPAYAKFIVDVNHYGEFDAEVWEPEPYRWRHESPARVVNPLVYEGHVGMATEEERVGSYREFADHVVPRIVEAGYDTLQLMAVAEHPYYGSFGYHVTNFFAPSSRFGTPDDLRYLVDQAHGAGLQVWFDLVHSHAAKNEVEGLSRFDGTPYAYFHNGARGDHPAWDTRCFDYSKPEVLHFLLSNLRYWLEDFRCDGFRFDGVTSMLFYHHGLGYDFAGYDDYFGDSVDEDALAYLHLANRLVHAVDRSVTTVAEDMSGLPGIAVSSERGGVGFDFRLGMGIPDFWIDLVRNLPDEQWPVGEIFHRLNNRRTDEPTIGYSESHDQAIVGDQTLILRLMGSELYASMSVFTPSDAVERGLRLSKLIRLMTVAVGGEGYLNFMGNEFGHPDWIDFPREANGGSYRYARRQWSLADDTALRYRFLAAFDRALLDCAREHAVLAAGPATLLGEHHDDQWLVFVRGELLVIVNFHPWRTHDGPFEVPPGRYRVALDTVAQEFVGDGEGRPPIEGELKPRAVTRGEQVYWELPVSIPPRSGLVF